MEGQGRMLPWGGAPSSLFMRAPIGMGLCARARCHSSLGADEDGAAEGVTADLRMRPLPGAPDVGCMPVGTCDTRGQETAPFFGSVGGAANTDADATSRW